jgi:hypothetical protein
MEVNTGKIIEDNLVPSAFHQTLGDEFTFEQDNNLKHKAKSTLELLSKNSQWSTVSNHQRTHHTSAGCHCFVATRSPSFPTEREMKVKSHASSETQPNQAAMLLYTAHIQPGSQPHQCVGGNIVHLATLVSVHYARPATRVAGA